MKVCLVGCVLALGCGSSTSTPVDGSATDQPGCTSLETGPIGGSRPVVVHVPPGYADCAPTPLVVMLHGYSASGALEESYLKLTALSDARGFLYAAPDGTIDSTSNHFWNATDACCDLYGTMVDDSSYLSDLIAEIGRHYSVDPKRVFLVGHSNGGFMSYRMACDHPDQVAAIASLAGAMFSNVANCTATTAVSVLEIHGTADSVIPFNGGSIQGHPFPGAQTTVDDWVTIDGCSTTPDTSGPALDLDSSLGGDETSVKRYASSCRPGGHAELWTIQGGSHIPTLSPTFSADVIDFLFAHPKP